MELNVPGGDGAGAGDVIQGALGDCWYISAMSLMATRPDLLKNCIVSESNKDKGVYTFKFSKAGKWRYVHIDDRIPCNKSGKVMYAHSKDGEKNVFNTWIIIVSKT